VRRALAGLLAAGLLAGCGAPSADLFVVTRSGKDRNANLKLLVSDDGTVTCNRRKPVPMGAKRLLDARELARDLEKQAALGLELPKEKGSILAYTVRLQAGTVAFADTSRGLPKTFSRVEAFTSDVAKSVCKVRRD
jgi:ABC-type amino acid transport substrate-binding protein